MRHPGGYRAYYSPQNAFRMRSCIFPVRNEQPSTSPPTHTHPLNMEGEMSKPPWGTVVDLFVFQSRSGDFVLYAHSFSNTKTKKLQLLSNAFF